MAEITAYAAQLPWRDGVLQSVFLGGGTPSLFAPASIAELLDSAFRSWRRAAPDVEVTLEANPGTVDRQRLHAFREAGVNRISFGVQSFHDRHLVQLGRIHSAAQAVDALTAAHEVGFENLNLDLMFAIPGQTVAEWEADLATAAAQAPAHISAYNLTYEDGTGFGARRRDGELIPVPEEAEVAMFARAQVLLGACGYTRYEISNYALPGRECAHNLNYWRAGSYLGVGAGAHSFAPAPPPGRRWSNERSPGRYIDRIGNAGHARVAEEVLLAQQARGEFAFLGLRCRAGVPGAAFEERFGLDLPSAFPHIGALVRDGLLEFAEGYWRLTDRGTLLADSVFATFL